MPVSKIDCGKFYVGGKYGDQVRQITLCFDGQVCYRCFSLESGESLWDGQCSIKALTRWAEREATTEESERMQVDQAVQEFGAKFEAELALYLLGASTEALVDELARRARSNQAVLALVASRLGLQVPEQPQTA